MLKANVEFDNFIASPLSPLKFLQHYVFSDKVEFQSYDEKTKEAVFLVKGVFSPVMEIRLKNLRQI